MSSDHNKGETDLEGEVSEDERLEAEALAAALEAGSASPAVPDDALESAALLRFSETGGKLDKARADRILEDILSGSARVASAPVSLWTTLRRRALVVGVPLLAAAAALLLWIRLDAEVPASPVALVPASPVALPPATIQVLGGQSEVILGGSSDALALAMRDYRHKMITRLGERYGP